MAGLILWDKMKITYNNRHNVYNGWFDPLGQDEDNIQYNRHNVYHGWFDPLAQDEDNRQ